ncbi:MAG: site-2 protease family protein [Ignavibacteria bacterium]|nr:site-2 protease family protein [Ignavibacteria bacterium]
MSDFGYEQTEVKQSLISRVLNSKFSFVINLILLLLTFFTTTVAGINWMYGPEVAMNLDNFYLGYPFSFSILFILGCHEFGHYFASLYHRVKATLPFFIPMPFIAGFINFGTLGAVIKTKTPIPNKRALMDIGVWGPIAGFVASLGILIYGFTHLPDVSYILRIHPDYFSEVKLEGGLHLEFGSNLLYLFLQKLLTNPQIEFVPPMSEIYHYPYLCVGWFGLFVTAMNLFPVGQLDGGHISYAMFGKFKHLKVAQITFYFLILLGLGGLVGEFFNLAFPIGWSGWLFWALIVRFAIKLEHPDVYDPIELDSKRKFLGYFAILIFVVSFIPTPFFIVW